MIKKTTIYTMLLVSGLLAYSQNQGVMQAGALTIQDLLDPSYSNVATYEQKYSRIDGSPYLDEEWSTGAVTLKDGQNFNNLLLKLDLYQDNLIVKKDGEESIIAKKLIKDMMISGRRFYNDSRVGYVEILAGEIGKYSLVQKTNFEIKDAKPATGYNAGDTKPKFEKDEKLMVLAPDRELLDLPNSKKKRISFLRNLNSESRIAEYNPKKIEDLIIIFQIINRD